MATAALMMVATVLFGGPLFAAEPSPLVGILMPSASYDPVLAGLREGLVTAGYREEVNLRLRIETGGGERQSNAAAAARLVAAKPEVILTVTTPLAHAAKEATRTIPIVFVSVGAPIESGLVAGFASSRNNLAGVSSYAASLSGKRLELLREIAPGSKKALLIVSTQESIGQTSARHSQEAARRLRHQVVRRNVASAAEIEKLLAVKWTNMADGVLLLPGALTGRYVEKFIDKSKNEWMPLIVYEDTLVRMGALASYGSDRSLTGIQAAKLVAKLLKGAKPADLPIETPDRFILSVNLATAKAIGLRIPRSVLDRVDRLAE